MERKDILRNIPSVDELLAHPQLEDFTKETSHQIIVDSIREVLDSIRREILNLDEAKLSNYKLTNNRIINKIISKIDNKKSMNLRPVVNATGTLLHTNLGRALLCQEAYQAVWNASNQYTNLELDLDTGKRGLRYDHVEEIICDITGGESAIVVNNNAAAVTLVLSALVNNKEVIVSRGELVEIGGSFRIPEVLEQSGARLVEVGATNKTHTRDYESRINDETGALLKVHTSNYRIVGFSETVSTDELVKLAKKNNIISIEDVGSGVLIDLSKYGLTPEPTVQSTIKAGIDIVTFSGDKLLGGPQAGIIVGKKSYIDIIKRHPLNRAFRIDKLTLAALEATLKVYQENNNLIDRIPTLRMLLTDEELLKNKAKILKDKIYKYIKEDVRVEINKDYSQVGGGALPIEKLPTYVVSVSSVKLSANQINSALREYKKPIISRITKDKVIFDVRTILDDQLDIIVEALNYILKC